jgi:hypothetical protein
MTLLLESFPARFPVWANVFVEAAMPLFADPTQGTDPARTD